MKHLICLVSLALVFAFAGTAIALLDTSVLFPDQQHQPRIILQAPPIYQAPVYEAPAYQPPAPPPSINEILKKYGAAPPVAVRIVK